MASGGGDCRCLAGYPAPADAALWIHLLGDLAVVHGVAGADDFGSIERQLFEPGAGDGVDEAQHTDE